MTGLYPVFRTREFGQCAQPVRRPAVEWCRWQAVGGCEQAQLTAPLPNGAFDLDVWGGLLRRPVELYSDAGRLAWWGYVHSVHVQDDQAGARVSMDDVANRVRVAYGQLEPEALGGGMRQVSAWGENLASQAAYGIKEREIEIDLANAAQAGAARAVALERYAWPGVRPVVGQDSGKGLVTVECRGWWNTLGWRFAESAAGLVEHSTRAPNTLVDVGTSAQQSVGQSLSIDSGGWQAESLWVSLRRVGAPSGSVSAYLCADAGGAPGGVLAGGGMVGSALPDSNPRWVRFVLSAPVPMSAGVYWIVLTDSSTKGDANYYRVLVDAAGGYSGGAAVAYNGSAWSALGCDLQFKLAGTMESTAQIAASVAAYGQFLAGTRIESGSGIFTNPYRGGEKSALQEIQAHLAGGSNSGGGLQARVSRERWVVVSARPGAESARLEVRSDGILRYLGGQIAQPGDDLAGQWALLNTGWGMNAAAWQGAGGRLYVEAAEYRAGVCRAISEG